MKKAICVITFMLSASFVSAGELVKVSVFAGLNDKSAVSGFKIINHETNKVIGKTNAEGYYYAQLEAGTKLRFFDQRHGASQTIVTITPHKKNGFDGYWDPVATWWPFPRPVFSDDVTRVLPPGLTPEPPLPKIPNEFGWIFPVPPKDSWSLPTMDLQISHQILKYIPSEIAYNAAASQNMTENKLMYVHESRPTGYWD